MDKYKEIIDNQIGQNMGTNLFHEDGFSLEFSKEYLQEIEGIKYLDNSSLDLLTNYAVSRCLEEFYRINQYYNFDDRAKEELKEIYDNLFIRIKEKSVPYEEIFRLHSSNLKRWLEKSNTFAKEIYKTEAEILEPVACAEYSADMQLDILQLDISVLHTPVLDIGCGKAANLVKYLRENCIEAFGIDRFPNDSPYIENANWLDYDYVVNKWGAIISNLGFSNHFRHHHLREDGNYIGYAKKYMQILYSLKIDGSFHYAPNLPFIEQYLDINTYRIEKKDIGCNGLCSVKVTRLI
ncbi:hypothetical protein [Prevotella sp. 10(H)]|uniref:hypothetical protein n=1 Tax=Prevotella sp. 10(H) TaxID=1158294 RepID=UPI0006905364|nr:hypothetical protein [Prevotella sp. 10(H)]